jgi:hypothetical protein
MTFDIAPDWLGMTISSSVSLARPGHAERTWAPPAPPSLDRHALMALVRELCAEGSLPEDQMHAIIDSSEFSAHPPINDAQAPSLWA